MRRFWFTLAGEILPGGTQHGCGISAASRTRAEEILENRVIHHGRGVIITGCIEDIDVSKLDPNHVLPNMGSVVVEGVWYPLSY